MKFIKDSAIVVAGRDLGESDMLITFITREHGKMKAVAKGARRSRKRFLNALEPCTLLDFRIVPSRSSGLGRLDSVEVSENYPAIRSSATCFMFASLCCELSDLWIHENDQAPELFKLFQWYLESIDRESTNALRHTLAFKTRLLAIAGYRQAWDRCVICGTNPRGSKVGFGIDQGGCVCSSCRAEGMLLKDVSTGTLRSLAYLDSSGLPALDRLKMTRVSMKEAWQLLLALHRHLLQRTPNSYNVLNSTLLPELNPS